MLEYRPLKVDKLQRYNNLVSTKIIAV